MIETQTLLNKIASLRQRLEQAQGLAQDAGASAAALLREAGPLADLQRKIEAGARQQAVLDEGLPRPVSLAKAGGDGASLPTQLTSRASRLLRRAHELLGQLRAAAEDSLMPSGADDSLAQLHRETVCMTDAVVRMVQSFPAAPSAQIRLCEGLEAVLQVVADRLAVLTATLHQWRLDFTRRNTLADALSALAKDQAVDLKSLLPIAESIHQDMLQGSPISFPEAFVEDVAQQTAAHSLAVAQVIARVARHELEWRSRPLEPIVAALIHDVGMLRVPDGVLTTSRQLTDEQRRAMETHATVGAELAARIAPSASWLVEAAGQHHERLDGTGYPSGLRDLQIKPLIRLLTVCDMYAALCQPRAQRARLDPRTALADTLLTAEKATLDRFAAERLLLLSFYPVGSVVELSDGTVGVVTATHQGRRDLSTPARPVVALLTDSEGQALPVGRHLDLSEVEGCSILRVLPSDEKKQRLGKRYPQYAAR
jgi:HD-GYP domain-containing protein (c-di-GMP phosphodiesterase class II)